MDELDLLDRAVIACLPVIIKARPESSGRRIVDVQASCEAVDFDGDVILQEALLGSAQSFIATGHLDIDHLSEFGQRLGIPDPSSYIVGRPLDVRKGPDNSTFVEGEISKSIDGRVDVVRNRYDEFWASLQRDPPVVWFSSVYGWPKNIEDCMNKSCGVDGPSRYLIKSMDWRSLAFTRSPKNTALTHPTRIVTAKSYITELAKSMRAGMGLGGDNGLGSEKSLASPLPRSMDEVWDSRVCPSCGVHDTPSLLGYRHHFSVCKGFPSPMSDVYAHATMHRQAMNSILPIGSMAGL